MTGLSLEHLRVVVEIPQQHIGPLRRHSQARIVLPDGAWLPAAELRIPPRADASTHTFRVLVTLPEGDHGVFPGTLAKVAFVSGEQERVLVPGEAVVRRGELTAVYVVDEAGRISLRHLRTAHPDRRRPRAGAGRHRPRRAGGARSHCGRHRLQAATHRGRQERDRERAFRRRLGISGRIAAAFLTTEITPLLALTGLLLGLFAVLVTPREEEPQIDVTFANVFIAFPGASAAEVESLVSTPAEQIVSELEGVEHVFSASTPGMSALTVQFDVGQPRTEAIVRLYNAFYSNQDWLPANSRRRPAADQAQGHRRRAGGGRHAVERRPGHHRRRPAAHRPHPGAELQRVPGTRDIETLGGPDRVVRVDFDPERLAGYQLALDDLRRRWRPPTRPRRRRAGERRPHRPGAGRHVPVDAGRGRRPGGRRARRRAHSAARRRDGACRRRPAGPLRQLRHRPGRRDALPGSGGPLPGGHHLGVEEARRERRDRGRSRHRALRAAARHLLPRRRRSHHHPQLRRDGRATRRASSSRSCFATLSVVCWCWLFLGRREALSWWAPPCVVTLALTLFASWPWGFTLNRVIALRTHLLHRHPRGRRHRRRGEHVTGT
jgi:hypothetical protein